MPTTHFPMNPKVLECYQKHHINLETIKDIVHVKGEFKTVQTCVCHIPKNYTPQDYVFALDLDNTLTYHEKTLYVKHADDIHLLPNRFSVLQKIFEMGYTIVVFTNQATMNAPTAQERMKNFLKQVKLPIYVFAAVKKDKYRKPEIGMWDLFLKISGIKPKKIYFSGDALGREFDFADSDKEFGEAIGATILTPEEVFGEFDLDSIPTGTSRVNTRELVLFVGAPGSNKTTLYKEKYPDYVHVNKDSQKTREMSVFRKALKEGRNIVVDDTNPTREVRETFIGEAKKLGYKITILYFVKAGHNYNDRRAKKVPDVVYHMFFKKLERPGDDEGDMYLVW